MRAPSRIAVAVFLLAGVAVAGNEPTEELKHRADTATGSEQTKLCLEYAHRRLAEADKSFNDGNVDQGQAAIREVVEYAHKAANTATERHLKETEIDLRRLAKRMHDIGETLAFEDRDPVRKAVDEIEQIRSDLLVKMWGPQAEPKGKS